MNNKLQVAVVNISTWLRVGESHTVRVFITLVSTLVIYVVIKSEPDDIITTAISPQGLITQT